VRCSEGEIRQAGSRFVGVIEQTPPPFSAKKIAGVPAYKLARKNQPVELKAAKVEIKKFEITNVQGDRVGFVAEVASGTYLRCMAHDMGQLLGVGGHLCSLRRTAVGEFCLEEACKLEDLERRAGGDSASNVMSDNKYYVKSAITQHLRHPRTLLPAFPSVTAPPETLPRLLNGNPVNLPEFSSASLVKVFRSQTELIAVAQRVAGTLFQPKVVLGSLQSDPVDMVR